MQADQSQKYYLVFIIVTTLMLPYAALRFPETKGLSLEEIGALFGDEVVFDLHNLSTEEQKALDARVAASADIAGIENATSDKAWTTEHKAAV